ncbi:MAG: hypothetical protein K2W85_12015 [Phycisphaerales bacterium]|nr:hypothetical protein [Phycisphaerales bacterium]
MSEDHVASDHRLKDRAEKPGVTCPHCWHKFAPSEALAVARTSALGPDPVVAGEPLRFLPSRFNRAGNPIDPAGAECTELACSRCRATITRSNLSAKPVFVSMVGGPQSGKSFLLSSAVRRMRQALPDMGYRFVDASPSENQRIVDLERKLFEPADPAAPIREQTDPQREVRAFQFHLKPELLHQADDFLLVLYDNPGEHFLPNHDRGTKATRHLARSKIVIFVLDPLAERGIRARCIPDHPLVKGWPASGGYSHDTPPPNLFLSEMASRAMKFKGVHSLDQIHTRLIIAITKSDLCPDLYKHIGEYPCTTPGPGGRMAGSRIQSVSRDVAAFMDDTAREFASTVRAIDPQAIYMPVSVLRPNPAASQAAGERFECTAMDVQPKWAEAPFLYAALSVVHHQTGGR